MEFLTGSRINNLLNFVTASEFNRSRMTDQIRDGIFHREFDNGIGEATLLPSFLEGVVSDWAKSSVRVDGDCRVYYRS